MGKPKNKRGRKVRLGQMKAKREPTVNDLLAINILQENKLGRFQTNLSDTGVFIDMKDAMKHELLQVMNVLMDQGYILLKTKEKNVFNIVKMT